MPRAIAFWVLVLLWVVLGFWFYWPAWGPIGVSVVIPLFLFILLGWQVYGPPLR